MSVSTVRGSAECRTRRPSLGPCLYRKPILFVCENDVVFTHVVNTILNRRSCKHCKPSDTLRLQGYDYGGGWWVLNLDAELFTQLLDFGLITFDNEALPLFCPKVGFLRCTCNYNARFLAHKVVSVLILIFPNSEKNVIHNYINKTSLLYVI